MADLKFLHGKNLSAEQPITPGTVYLDLQTNELWYDDPSGENDENHIRLYDHLYITEDIEVSLGEGVGVGGYAAGTTIESGTPITTILKNLLQKSIPPTYTKPTITLTNDGGAAAGNYEVGETVAVKLKATFTKNDAGDLTSLSITKNNTALGNSTTSSPMFKTDSLDISESTVTYKGVASYNDAPKKPDNFGNFLEPEKDVNRFFAGTITSSGYSFTGKRKAFYGTGVGQAPTELNSDFIRGLSGNKLNPAKGTTLTINVAAGQQYIIFAYPKAVGVSNPKVTYVEANDGNMLGKFSLVEKKVEGANKFTEIDYYVFSYSMAVPAAAAMTITVAI